MKVSLQQLLREADRAQYAVPAFNYSDIWELLAIVETAAQLRAPVICQSHTKITDIFSVDWLGGLGRAIMDNAICPVINHLDHSASEQLCIQAIDSGYASVMFDGSSLALEENIHRTQQVTAYARQHGDICVEGEIGRIRGNSDEGTFAGGDYLADVDDVVRMAAESGVDSLAVGLGNAHGFYRQRPQLDFALLERINAAVDTPLVLHGGTGIPDEDIRKAIRCGINKVNVGTHLHDTYVKSLCRTLHDDPEATLRPTMTTAKEAIRPVVEHWIRLCMANDRY